MSDPLSTLLPMDNVVELDRWRGRREPDEARLERAVERLERLLGRRERRSAPEWLRTGVLAIQGCMALGMIGDAADRTERLVELVERRLGTG
jgi:hypothetical protein